MPPIRSRRIYFFAELSITHEDPSKINQSIVVKFGYLKTSHIGIGERGRWRQTVRRLDRASEPWFFPGHPSNALRHGRYLGLKMARFRVERWAYARSWLRCDWISLSYREENWSTLPPLLPPVPGTSAKGKYPYTFSRPTKAIVYIIHVYEQLTVCSVGCFLLSVLWYDSKNRKRFSFLCNSHKTLSRLKLNLKRRLILLDVRFKNRGISQRWCSRSRSAFRPIAREQKYLMDHNKR